MRATPTRRQGLRLGLAVALFAAILATAAVSLAATPNKAVLDYSAYVGAKGPANKKLPAYVIGWVNGQGGTVPGTSFPSTTRGAVAAINMVNAELGGVHGRPLKLVQCFIASAEEEGTRCGQKMANDKRVVVVAHGVVVTGNQSEYNVLKGSKPVVMGVSASNADVKAKNVFSLIGTSISVLSSFGPYVKKVYPNVKTVAIIYPNQAGADVAAQSHKKSMESVGLKATLIAHDPNASDLVGVATQANGYDLIDAACTFADCALIAKGLAAIGSKKPVLTTPLLFFIPPPAWPGGDLPHWDVGVGQACICDPNDPEIKLFTKKAQQYHLSAADQKDAFAQLSWTTLLAIVKIMDQIPLKQLTPAAITKGLKAFRGPLVMGAPDVACGTVDPTQPAACANEAQFYQYQGGGKWKKTSGYIGPAKK